MLFRRDIEPRCEYCRFGVALDAEEIGCIKQGITARGESCPKFRYDPVKREPEVRSFRSERRFSQEDFEL